MSNTAALLDNLKRWLRHPRLPWHLAAIAIALSLPSLWLGWQTDDHVHRAALVGLPGAPEVSRTPAGLFDFVRSDPAEHARAIDKGIRPWWSSEDLRLSFFRPVTGVTHWLDYKLWPETPALMHAQSLVWFGGMVALAAILYCRMMPSAWVAGLAALAFALDDAHGLPAAWLANRNATISVFFGLLTLLAHDRWRRNGWTAGALAGSVALLLALLANEGGVAVGGYLLAYAVFVDRDTWGRRLRSLAPYVLVGIVWWVTYKQMGYGAHGSAMYIDPVASPLRFVRAVVERGPILLWGQWVMLSDAHMLLSRRGLMLMWLVAVVFLAVIAAVLAPVVRRNRVARFWALGMILAIVPLCATYPSDRLLGFVGIGAMGLLAQFIAAVVSRAEWAMTTTWRRRLSRVLCGGAVVVHFLLAPVGLARASTTVARFGEVFSRAAASLPTDPAIARQWVLIVAAPTDFVCIYGPLLQTLKGRVAPTRMLVLASSIQPVTIHAPDEHTLVVRPQGGWFATRRATPTGHVADRPLFELNNMFAIFDGVFRDDRPMELGTRFELTGATIEITEVTPDHRPAEATVRFKTPLRDPYHRWLQWENGVYAPFTVPEVGQTITLPAVTVPF